MKIRTARTPDYRSRRHRNAIVTLEAIIWLPVLAILLAAVIEMGLIMSGAMHVAAASRLGAKLAAETAGLDSMNTAAVAAAIRGPIDDYFENAGFGANATRGVRLQHNIDGGGSEEDGICPEQLTPPLPDPPVGPTFLNRPYSVRVVVGIEATRAAPNILRTFGYDISNVTLELATTYPYEELP